MKNIACIGCGNMGSSLIAGLIKQGYPANDIWVTNRSEAKLAVLQQQYSVHTTTDNLFAIAEADLVIISVKPKDWPALSLEIGPIIAERKCLVLSLLAGVNIQILNHSLGEITPIVRCMANLPAMLGVGATGLYANSQVNRTQREIVEKILNGVGVTVWLEQESLLDAVTALSGSGPAYFFLIMEILVEVGVQLGLNREDAALLTRYTALGAARMAIESGQSCQALRERVTSPGGTTEAALGLLTTGELQALFSRALSAAKTRAAQLGAFS